MLAKGRIVRETEHAEVPVTYLICRKLIDRSELLRQLNASGNDTSDDMAWSDALLGHTDEVRRPDPESACTKAELPARRDFR